MFYILGGTVCITALTFISSVFKKDENTILYYLEGFNEYYDESEI